MTPDERRLTERRTMALRGPGAGGVTPPQSQAASNPCLNCGTNIQLEFCPECGQATIDPDPTLREFLHELAEEFLHWDGKLLSTFRLLVMKPGDLTREYLGGKRIRYISPLRVYFSCSLLFFFVSAIVPQTPIVARTNSLTTRIGPITIHDTSATATIAALDSLALHGQVMGRVWGRHFGNAMRRRAEVPTLVATAIPKTMFVLVPLFAALVMLAFRQSRRRFPQHLAYALHVHAFLFLVLTVMLARRFTTIVPLMLAIQYICLSVVAVYLVRSARTVYDVSLVGAVSRTALVAATYFALFLVAMIVTFGLIVLVHF